MASPTVIANMALSHLGTAKAISSMDERSTEAQTVSVFYDEARRDVLRAFAWPFATKLVTLGLIEALTNSEWSYLYQVPSDSLLFRRILSGYRNDTDKTRVPFRLAYGNSGTVLYTDKENAVGEYTVDIANVDRFPSDFRLAFSYYLAFLSAPRLTAGDPFKLGDRAMKLYIEQITKAQAMAGNEERPDPEPTNSFTRSREEY